MPGVSLKSADCIFALYSLRLNAWAASVRPLCGRFGQAKSVHCAGRPCRRHTPWANSSAPNAGGAEEAYRVYMSFMFRNGWLCQFLEEDLKTSLPRKVILGSQEKVREMARRGGAAMSLDVLQALDHGIEIGRGGIWLELSDEQYQKLRVR